MGQLANVSTFDIHNSVREKAVLGLSDWTTVVLYFVLGIFDGLHLWRFFSLAWFPTAARAPSRFQPIHVRKPSNAHWIVHVVLVLSLVLTVCVNCRVKAQRSPAVQSVFGFGAAHLSRFTQRNLPVCWFDSNIALSKCSCANFTVSYNGSCVTILFLFYVSVF